MSDGVGRGKNHDDDHIDDEDMAVDDKANPEETRPQNVRPETMEESPLLHEFSGSGRTGRRNAMPDIMQEGAASTGTAGITEMLNQLSCGGGGGGGSGDAGAEGRSRADEELGACGGVANDNQNQKRDTAKQ